MTDFAWPDASTPAIDPGLAQWSLAEIRPCPAYRRDYLKLASWLFAFLFGPTLIALAIWLA